MLNKLVITVFLIVNWATSFCQNNLCYDDIDKIVAAIQNIKCSKLDTGFVTQNSNNRYRECYIADSTGHNLLGLMTAVRDSSNYWTNVNYYFHGASLIKVEVGDWNGERKLNLQYYYYTTGQCESFNLDKHRQVQQIYYKRLATKLTEDWRRN